MRRQGNGRNSNNMPRLTYEQLVYELSYGREVEFTFNNIRYAISAQSLNKRYFSVFNPQLTVEFRNLDDLLGQVTISGQTIEEIWPHVSDLILF